MTPRRVLWLIEQLPETSAYTASVKGGPEHRGWTMQNTLLAGVFNGVAGGNYQRGGGKGKKPKFIEPPRIKRAAQRGRTKAAAHIQRGLAIAKQALTTPDD